MSDYIQQNNESKNNSAEKKTKEAKPLSKNRAWLYVALGGALEIIWASGFKYEAVPSLLVLISLLLSFDLIIRASKALPIGTVYAVFAGIGTIGTVIVEAVMEGSISPAKVGIILLLLIFIVGLKLSAGGGEAK